MWDSHRSKNKARHLNLEYTWTREYLRDWIPYIGLVPKVIPLNIFLDHSRFRKSQEIYEKPFLCWEFCPRGQPMRHSPRKRPRNTWGTSNIISERLANLEATNNLRGITFGIRPMWGLRSLSLIFSWHELYVVHSDRIPNITQLNLP